eukprot:966362-Amphidinium_carterae.1
MLYQIRSFWNEGLMSGNDDLQFFQDFYDGHEHETYPRWWRFMLKWLSFQDIDDVIDKFNKAIQIRDGVPPEEDRDEEFEKERRLRGVWNQPARKCDYERPQVSSLRASLET